MFRSLMFIECPSHIRAEVVEKYIGIRVLELAVEEAGATSCELASAADPAGGLVVIGHWPNEQAYQRWLDHPIREKVVSVLADLATIPKGAVYTVEHRAGA